MPCELIENYMAPGDGPYLKLKYAKDIDKAYTLGFTCMGHPSEIMHKLTLSELNALL